MTCQSLISDLSGVESPSVATARMHLLLRFSRYGPGKLAVHADGPCVCTERLKRGCSTGTAPGDCGSCVYTLLFVVC